VGEDSSLPITVEINMLVFWIWERERGRGTRTTISIYSSISALSYVEEVRPARDVGEVEVEVVGFGEGVEVGGVEFEDVHCVEGAEGGHFEGVRGVLLELDLT
jgi:hypothetical protein